MFFWLLKAGKFRAIYFGYILKLCFELRNTVSGEGREKKSILGIDRLFVNQLSWAVKEGFNFWRVHLLQLNPLGSLLNKYKDSLCSRKIY